MRTRTGTARPSQHQRLLGSSGGTATPTWRSKPEAPESDGVTSLPPDVEGLADSDLLPVAWADAATWTVFLGSVYLFCRHCDNMFEDLPTPMAIDGGGRSVLSIGSTTNVCTDFGVVNREQAGK